MSSLNKPLWKSVLVSCVGILLVSGVAVGAPDGYIVGADHAVNKFTANTTGDLTGFGLWALGSTSPLGFEVYQVWVYDDFNPAANTFGNQLGSGVGTISTDGYLQFDLNSEIPLEANDPFYAKVKSNFTSTFPAHSTIPVPGPGLSYYSTDDTNWTDLHTGAWTGLTWYGGGSVGASAYFMIDPIMTSAPGIAVTATRGDDDGWDITIPGTFTGPNNLAIEKATEAMKPLVAEIEVTGGLTQIKITESVTNDTTEDWIGYGFQLGFWDDDRFISSDDLGLYFGFSTSDDLGAMIMPSPSSIYFGNGLVAPGETTGFELLINLASGYDQYTFALRQYAIPEPGTAMLLAIAGLMLLGFRRRR